MTRWTAVLVVAIGSVSASSCEDAKPTRTVASVSVQCVAVGAEFRIPPNPNGPPDDNQNSERSLARALSDPDEKTRADAAMHLLRHSERRIEAVRILAIRKSTLLGDYRILNNLERIVTQHADDGDGRLVAYPIASRIAAASAIGRIVEADRSAPPGRPSDGTGGGISDADIAVALDALTLAACPSEPRELRAAALEAIGLLRTRGAVDFLEATFSDPEIPEDEVFELLLRGLSARSLSMVTHNNHLVDSGLTDEIRAVIQAYNEATGAQ